MMDKKALPLDTSLDIYKKIFNQHLENLDKDEKKFFENAKTIYDYLQIANNIIDKLTKHTNGELTKNKDIQNVSITNTLQGTQSLQNMQKSMMIYYFMNMYGVSDCYNYKDNEIKKSDKDDEENKKKFKIAKNVFEKFNDVKNIDSEIKSFLKYKSEYKSYNAQEIFEKFSGICKFNDTTIHNPHTNTKKTPLPTEYYKMMCNIPDDEIIKLDAEQQLEIKQLKKQMVREMLILAIQEGYGVNEFYGEESAVDGDLEERKKSREFANFIRQQMTEAFDQDIDPVQIDGLGEFLKGWTPELYRSRDKIDGLLVGIGGVSLAGLVTSMFAFSNPVTMLIVAAGCLVSLISSAIILVARSDNAVRLGDNGDFIADEIGKFNAQQLSDDKSTLIDMLVCDKGHKLGLCYDNSNLNVKPLKVSKLYELYQCSCPDDPNKLGKFCRVIKEKNKQQQKQQTEIN